MIKKIKIQMKI